MNRLCKTAWGTILTSALLLPIVAGCGSSVGAIPSGQAARAALEAALTAWTQDAKPGEIAGTEPRVLVHDTPWGRGQKLTSFEVLGEEDGAAAEKVFTVKLSLTKPDRTEEARYHVLGVGPLMVFRDEDYLRNINMENGPSLVKPGGASRKSR